MSHLGFGKGLLAGVVVSSALVGLVACHFPECEPSETEDESLPELAVWPRLISPASGWSGGVGPAAEGEQKVVVKKPEPILADGALGADAEVEVVTWGSGIDLEALSNSSGVTITLPPLASIVAIHPKLDTSESSFVRWTAEIKGGGYAEILQQEDGAIDGAFFWPGGNLRPTSVESGEIRWRFTAKKELPEFLDYVSEPDGFVNFAWKGPEQCKGLASPNVSVDVLPLYNEAAKGCIEGGEGKGCGKGKSVQAWIADEFGRANAALADSGLTFRFKPLPSRSLEVASATIEGSRLDALADSTWQAGRTWDIAVLFVEVNTDRDGFAPILPSPKRALAVVRVSADPGKHALAHELGHMLGGRHHSDPGLPISYGHGFRVTALGNSTLMMEGGSLKKPIYSEPFNQKFQVQAGDEKFANNVCVFKQTAAEIAKFAP
ncbi:MAG TPA: hypothetical protein VF017_09040 [Thermoanaerobaculia bacterium]|nr:hypothetical protein [Thermoanaerobaculia bacterium]